MKVVTPYVYKVVDPERCGTHTVPQNKRINVFYLINYAHMRKKVVQHVTRFMIIMVVYTEIHEIDPNIKIFLHRILKNSSNCSL